jgi:hypothetical protein
MIGMVAHMNKKKQIREIEQMLLDADCDTVMAVHSVLSRLRKPRDERTCWFFKLAGKIGKRFRKRDSI